MGSLTAAVADRGISYRAAWGLLRAYERKLGNPLVVLERGRGASLALLGKRLVAADAAARRRLARTFQRLSLELDSASAAKSIALPRLDDRRESRPRIGGFARSTGTGTRD